MSTFAELKSRVKFKLQNHPRYTDTLVGSAVNKGIDELIIFTRDLTVVYETNTITETGSSDYQMEYELPTDLLFLKAVVYGTKNPQLKELSLEEMIRTREENSEATGSARYFYVRQEPSSSGMKRFLQLYPRPSSTETIKIYYLPKTTDLVDDTDVCPLDRVSENGILAYAAFYLVDGQPNEGARAMQFWNEFKFSRGETKTNLGVNDIVKTRRTR